MKKINFLVFGCALMVGQPAAYGQGTGCSDIMINLLTKIDGKITNLDGRITKIDGKTEAIEPLFQTTALIYTKLDQVITTLSAHTDLLEKILDTGNKTYTSLESFIKTTPFWWVKAVTEYNASKATFLVDFLLRACTKSPQTYTGPVSIALTGGCAVYKKLAFDPWVESASISGYNVGQYIAPYVMSKSWGDLGQEYSLMVGFYCLTQPQVRSTLIQQGKKWVFDPITHFVGSLARKGKDLLFSARGPAESDEESASDGIHRHHSKGKGDLCGKGGAPSFCRTVYRFLKE
jgi:hypothetical protein